MPVRAKTQYRYEVFISYADADRAWVEAYLLDALVQAGVRRHSEARRSAHARDG
jgi:hypothetical protein